MSDELHAADAHDVTDTGPLEWQDPQTSRLQVTATVALAVCMTVIVLMLVAYSMWGRS